MTKYLIVGPSWVGDMVMAQSLFITIKKNDPDAIIDVVGPAWSAPILERMPEVRHAITLHVAHGKLGLNERLTLGKQLRTEHYDKAIVIPRSFKSALVPFFAKIKQRIGFTGEQRFILLTERRKLDKQILNQTVKRFVSLGLTKTQAYPPADTPAPALTVDYKNQSSVLNKLKLDHNKPAIAMMAGAEYGPSKQWPLAYFRKVAEHYIDQGYQIWVLGGPKDESDGNTITEKLGDAAHNLCGQTTLVDAIDLFAKAELAISNDSGLMHIAAAVNTYVHALYGSTSEQFTPPLTEKHTIHNLHLACSPCFKRTCPLGHTNCQNQLTPDKIISKISL